MNTLALSLTLFISSEEPLLIKGLLWRRRGGGASLNSECKRTGEGEGSSLTLCLLCEKKLAEFSNSK